MKSNKLAGSVATAAIAFGIAIGSAVPASAINNIQPFGTQETLKYSHDAVEIGYTVDGIRPSSDVVPHPINGRLYESTVTVDAVRGWVTPMVPWFNARSESGHNYRVLNVPGLSGAAIPPGAKTTGKIYFDVVGDVPNSVVYNDGTVDLLGWIP
ncbi:DUF1942 domain-containing protein [Mycolicibacterium sp. XJ870]